MSQPNLATLMPQPRRRKMWPWLVAAGAVVLVIAVIVAFALMSGEPTSSTKVAPSPPVAPVAKHPVSETPTPTAPAKAVHPLGKRVVMADGLVDVTALQYRQPVAASMPAPEGQTGYEWGAAEVRVCLRKSPPDGNTVAVSEAPWELLYPDGSRETPSSSKYEQFPRPEYPVVPDRPMGVGRCTKGWITFPVPKGQKPGMISYAPQDARETTDWKIG